MNKAASAGMREVIIGYKVCALLLKPRPIKDQVFEVVIGPFKYKDEALVAALEIEENQDYLTTIEEVELNPEEYNEESLFCRRP